MPRASLIDRRPRAADPVVPLPAHLAWLLAPETAYAKLPAESKTITAADVAAYRAWRDANGPVWRRVWWIGVITGASRADRYDAADAGIAMANITVVASRIAAITGEWPT